MEYLCNGLTIDIAPGAFPLSTDSMVLAWFSRPGRDARILDLGSGCATLGHLLCAVHGSCRVTGIELDENAHLAALENIRRNRLDARISSICADLRCLPKDFMGVFDCCISNPPYFSGGPASSRTPLARREDHCTPGDLFRSAAGALKYGGDFYLVHKPERLAELIAQGNRNGLEAKRLLLVRHRLDQPVNLICLQFRKGGKPGLLWEEIALTDSQGHPTEVYKQIYHLQED